MKEESSESQKKLDRDLEVFEELPSETQELTILKDLAEKSAGSEKAALHDEIQQKSKAAPPSESN